MVLCGCSVLNFRLSANSIYFDGTYMNWTCFLAFSFFCFIRTMTCVQSSLLKNQYKTQYKQYKMLSQCIPSMGILKASYKSEVMVTTTKVLCGANKIALHALSSTHTIHFDLNHVYQQSLEKFCEILTSGTQAMYAVSCYMLYSTQAVTCTQIVFHTSPPMNPACAQYMKYKGPNCTNHGQCTYLMYIHSSKYWVPVLALIISGECAHSTCSEQFLSFQDSSNTCNVWFAGSCSISDNMSTAD